MARFYQPKETQGIYDAAPNRLTVNRYDRVLIGFQAANAQEYGKTTVDASQDVITSRYSINATTIEMNLDTRNTRSFFLTATQFAIMSPAPKDVIKPLEVVIREPAYPGKPAVGQQRDPAGCWAACLSYWLTVAPGRQDRRFIDIVGDFNGLWDSSGFIRVDGLRTQIAQQRGRYHMATEKIVPSRLADFVGRWPLLVGFRHPAGFGHMNVLTTYDDSNDLVRAMDPWFPNPPAGAITRESGQVVFSASAGDFQFGGQIAYRPLGYYRSAIPSGTIFVGYPEEYGKRMP